MERETSLLQDLAGQSQAVVTIPYRTTAVRVARHDTSVSARHLVHQAEAKKRTCGSCRACCKAPDIPELNKPRDTWCSHAVLSRNADGGCGRYATRPEVCRDFECGWKLGLGDEEDRPDRLGVIWQPAPRADGKTVIGFVEYRPGAMAGSRVRRYLEMWGAEDPEMIRVRRIGEVRFSPLTVEGSSVG